LAAIADWVAQRDDVAFLARLPATRSCTSICLTFPKLATSIAKQVAPLLEAEGVAFDVAPYRDAPAGLRVWGGATVDTADIAALLPWITWSLETVSHAT
jgi:phosphoserine aminotransferase